MFTRVDQLPNDARRNVEGDVRVERLWKHPASLDPIGVATTMKKQKCIKYVLVVSSPNKKNENKNPVPRPPFTRTTR